MGFGRLLGATSLLVKRAGRRRALIEARSGSRISNPESTGWARFFLCSSSFFHFFPHQMSRRMLGVGFASWRSFPLWVGVETKPRGYGQVLVLVSIYQGLRHFGYLCLTAAMWFRTPGSWCGYRSGGVGFWFLFEGLGVSFKGCRPIGCDLRLA